MYLANEFAVNIKTWNFFSITRCYRSFILRVCLSFAPRIFFLTVSTAKYSEISWCYSRKGDFHRIHSFIFVHLVQFMERTWKIKISRWNISDTLKLFIKRRKKIRVQISNNNNWGVEIYSQFWRVIHYVIKIYRKHFILFFRLLQYQCIRHVRKELETSSELSIHAKY